MSSDIAGTLRSIVGGAGDVSLVYGGFEIHVIHAAEFPWEKVFRFLLALQQEVWLEKREDLLFIVSKSSPD
jgi:hypothetical protein